MSSILQVRPAGSTTLIDVPALRGKSAYQHALESNLNMTEDEFNNLLANIVTVDNPGDSTPYKIQFVGEGQEPDGDTPDNIITIVLKS